MKIICDVCGAESASVFCTADEAALCGGCDCRVHHANKLASKHQRFSLLLPSSKESPTCDICQGKRAFLFCQEDRALLCRDCDISIHTINEHTKKHNRFLLTGVKLSATSCIYTSCSSSASSSSSLSSANLINGQASSDVSGFDSQPLTKNHISVPPRHSNPAFVDAATGDKAVNMMNKSCFDIDNLMTSKGTEFSAEEISDYPIQLISSLPGWHIEDFLDSSSLPLGFSKGDDGGSSFMNVAGDNRNSNDSFASENLGIWVPQAPISPLNLQTQHPSQLSGQNRFQEPSKYASNVELGDKRWAEDVFTVPHFIPSSSIGSKRQSPFS